MPTFGPGPEWDRARALFGDIDPGGPLKYLRTRGWKLRDDWTWTLPYAGYFPTDTEWFCVDLLWGEWDFGGISR